MQTKIKKPFPWYKLEESKVLLKCQNKDEIEIGYGIVKKIKDEHFLCADNFKRIMTTPLEEMEILEISFP